VSAIIWGEFDSTVGKVTGISKAGYIEVTSKLTAIGAYEFEVNVWSKGQSSGSPASHGVIGWGNIEQGKQAAERLLQEGLDRF
jgi:hypothetical protein